MVTTINIWARKPSCVCNERMGRAVLKCKGLEHFVCQPEFKKKLVGNGGNEVGRVLHVLLKITECLLVGAWGGSCSSKIPVLDLKVDKVFGIKNIKDLAVDFIFLPSGSKAETLPKSQNFIICFSRGSSDHWLVVTQMCWLVIKYGCHTHLVLFLENWVGACCVCTRAHWSSCRAQHTLAQIPD